MEGPPSPKKKRIPKACAACRTSKVRCDGGKPCTRCRKADVHCDYIKPPEDIVAEKLAQIEAQVQHLTNRVPDASTAVVLLQLQQQRQQHVPDRSPYITAQYSPPQAFQQQPHHQAQTASPVSMASGHQYSHRNQSQSQNQVELAFNNGYREPSQVSPMPQSADLMRGTKRKYRDFEINAEPDLDVIGKGLISYEAATMYFDTFFQGCDKYVPVFDPAFDTFASVRSRSSMLFDTICAVGCRVEHGATSQQYQDLSNATKAPICSVMLGSIPPSVEVIQALLVDASYSEKGWLMTSLALKMALDINLPASYSQLCAKLIENDADGCEGLFRQARVWFCIFVLENIMSIDCGKKPGITAGEGMKRCRLLLSHPSRTSLDFRLLAQVELNSIRALAHEKLSPKPDIGLTDQELGDIVQGTRIDLSVWLSDWINIVESKVESQSDRETLIINLRIQRDWSEMTMLCKGLQGIGIDNVAIMSDEQRNLIHLAKISARRHLSTILSNPKSYLRGLRYGMDFVWAKCAFSVLLLLKLARLLPESTNMSELVVDARTLLRELSQIEGSNNIYFRILNLSVEKCERVLKGDFPQSDSRGTQAPAMDSLDAEMDFQSYVPKEFILEWNFPGLTFCWIPFDFGDLFLDFGTGFGAG